MKHKYKIKSAQLSFNLHPAVNMQSSHEHSMVRSLNALVSGKSSEESIHGSCVSVAHVLSVYMQFKESSLSLLQLMLNAHSLST